ncbi:MAG: hypothetical protein EB051_05575 [Chlamydiia bacterium]|nr:hypothetical protein [Chlamydiia bacterium]
MNILSPLSRQLPPREPNAAQSEQSTRSLCEKIYDLANTVFEVIAWTFYRLSQGCNWIIQSVFGNIDPSPQIISTPDITSVAHQRLALPAQQAHFQNKEPRDHLDDLPSTRAANPIQLTQARSQAPIPIKNTIHVYPGPLNELEKPVAHLKQGGRLEMTSGIYDQVELSIRKEDLFRSQAHAIVNAANTHLSGGGGIDGAIHREGGLSYAEEHGRLKEEFGGKYLRKNANYVEGYAALIGSGALLKKFNIEQVMVVAAPNCQNENPKSMPPKVKNALYSCYLNSLILAEEQGLKSIAFPSLGTGIFKFPVDDAADIALRAIHDFLETRVGAKNIKTISIHFLPTEPDSVTFDPYRSVCRMAP